MHDRRVTSKERYLISTLRKRGFTPAQIATIVGRNRSSITRETRRNATRADGGYRPSRRPNGPAAVDRALGGVRASPPRSGRSCMPGCATMES